MLSYFKNLPLRYKLLLANGSFIVLILILMALSVSNMMTLKAENDRLNNVLLPSINQIGELTDKYWMTRIRLLLIPVESKPEKREELKKQVEEFSKLYFDFVKGYGKYIKDDTDKKKYEELVQFTNTEKQDLKTLIPMVMNNDFVSAQNWQGEHGADQYDGFDEASEALLEHNSELIEANHTQAKHSFETALNTFTIMSILIIVLMASFSFWFANLLDKPMQMVKQALKQLSLGNLAYQFEALDTKDELGELTRDMQSTIHTLKSLITDIQKETKLITVSSNGLASTSDHMASTSDELVRFSSTATTVTSDLDMQIKTVAAAIEESSANIREVFSASAVVGQNNQQVNTSVMEISSNMTTMAKDSENMSAAVGTVAAAIEEMSASLAEVSKNAAQAARVAGRAEETAKTSSTAVHELGNSAKEIGNVVDVIKSIAAQTNLLALNATIEAASAGESGKGFAVVANEVKELARQSSTATEDIRTRIEEMQRTTAQVVNSIVEIAQVINELNQTNQLIAVSVGEQTSTVSEISRNVARASQAANNITGSVLNAADKASSAATKMTDSNRGVQQISTNLEELTQGSNEISRSTLSAARSATEMSQSIEKLNHFTAESAEDATTVQNAAQTLSSLAVKLEQLVGSFKL
jgi:methyl-accepting chemotaxis protein